MDVKIKQNLKINSEGSCQNFVDLAVLDMVGDMALMWPAIFGIFFLMWKVRGDGVNNVLSGIRFFVLIPVSVSLSGFNLNLDLT